MNPEQWLSLKWNGGSTMSDRWLNQSKIIHTKYLYFLYKIYKEGELNTRCDMFLRYSEGDIPFVF